MLKNPDKQFPELWKGWYDLFDTDVSKFPLNKEIWKNTCEKYKIKSHDDYKKYHIKYKLPELPKELYNIDDIDHELCETLVKVKRR